PMLATPGSMPSDQRGWAFELKWDGLRALLIWQPGRLRIESRNRNDITSAYPEIRGLAQQLGSREAILDGELVAFDEHGSPNFELLQSRMHLSSPSVIRRQAAQVPVTYVIFDLLYLDGQTLTALPYKHRRELLQDLQLHGASWQTPANHTGQGRQLLELTAARGLEGLIAKRLQSVYSPGIRSQDWLKIKNFHRQEFVVGGWLKGQRSREPLGALLLGYYERQRGRSLLRYAGRVGSGFSERQIEDLTAVLAAQARSDSPFSLGQPPAQAHFVDPELVAEIEFSGWTKQGILRHSVFKGLRHDKSAKEVLLERPDTKRQVTSEARPESGQRTTSSEVSIVDAQIEVQGRTIKLSNRTKVLYPASGFTKGQLIDYYTAVAPVLLNHLAGRPLTIKRYPNGVHGSHFFQKHCPTHRPPWVQTTPVWSSSQNERVDYCLVEDLPTLIWVANLAAIELHPSLACASQIDRPTTVVFDLDPGAPAGQRECCRVALWIHDLLQALDLQSVVKTSGAKGLQVYLPLNSSVSYEQTKPFAHAVARLLEKEHPDLVTSRMSRKLRTGKVLIDWSQNDPHKTTVCVYSLRAGDQPEVSTPLAWEQVREALSGKAEPSLSLRPDTLLERVSADGDLFEPALERIQSLPNLDEGPTNQPPDTPTPGTRAALYRRARELGVPGRSRMTLTQLRGAIAATEDQRPSN
ncbi:MAG: DNA ligase D, partial [Solirubrobacteraceae bacterium]